MTECNRCGKPNPPEFHTCTPAEVMLRNAYLKGMADGAESVNRWISVKDKIPPSCKTVIACNNQKQVDAVDFIHINDNQFREDYPRITHWMPLPAPPQPEVIDTAKKIIKERSEALKNLSSQ